MRKWNNIWNIHLFSVRLFIIWFGWEMFISRHIFVRKMKYRLFNLWRQHFSKPTKKAKQYKMFVGIILNYIDGNFEGPMDFVWWKVFLFKIEMKCDSWLSRGQKFKIIFKRNLIWIEFQTLQFDLFVWTSKGFGYSLNNKQ